MYVLAYGINEDELQSGNSEELVKFIQSQNGEFLLRCGYEKDGSDASVYSLKRQAYQTAYVHYRDSETSFRFIGEGSKLHLSETFEPIEGMDDETAYLRLDEFSGNAASEFKECLSVLKERGRKNLILDLRTDGGGYLDILCKIASYLLRNAQQRNPVVAKAIYRSGKETDYRADGNEFGKYFAEDSKIRILADESTASASECLIGAMVDYGTVGFEDIYLRQNADGIAKTYGKGIMQSHFTNVEGAAMKLTTAEIFWPNGKSIHGVGVVPQDGANSVSADLIWGKSDPMLESALTSLAEK